METVAADPSTSRLRVAGFVITVAGAAALGLGCALAWVSVHLAGDDGGVLDQTYPGIDLWQGRVALACAAILLMAVLILRMRRSAGGGKGVAGLMIAAGIVAFGLSASATLTEPAALETDAVDAMVDSSAIALGVPADQARSQVEALVDLGIESSAELGVFIATAGAAVATIGAALGLAWASAAPAPPASPARSAPPGSGAAPGSS